MSIKMHSLPLRMSLAYLIETDQSLVLVDAGIRGEEKRVLKKMQAIGREDLKLIYITHAHLDHYGCAAALRRITGAQIAIHGQDEEAMALGETRLGEARGVGRLLQTMLPLANPILSPEPTRADILVDDGDDLSSYGLAASILHTPGHTLGSTCLLAEDRIAFAGDLLTNSNRPRMQRYFAQNWSLLPKSLDLLINQHPELIYTGHGREPIRSESLLELGNFNSLT